LTNVSETQKGSSEIVVSFAFKHNHIHDVSGDNESVDASCDMSCDMPGDVSCDMSVDMSDGANINLCECQSN